MVGRGKNLIKPLFVNGLSSLLEPVVVLAVTKKEKGSPSTKEISCERLVMTGAKFIALLAVSKQEKLKNVWLPTRFRFKRRKSAGDEFSFKDAVPFQGLPMASES